MKVSADFETRSPVDLKKHGAYVYFEHPQTEVLMCAYRIDDGPLQLWTYDQPAPADLCRTIGAGAMIHAWNANFEALGFDLLADRHDWPRPKIEQYVDTMAAAAAMSLPRALGDAAQALGLDILKDKEGMRLIRKFSIPKRDGTFNDPKDHPEDWQKFCDYCRRDVEVEEAIARRIVPLSDAEQRLWTLNLKINRRGIRIDRQSAQSALVIAEKAKKALDREMRIVTGGYVPACSQPGKLVEWVQAQGVDLSSAGKADIIDLLGFEDVPANVRKALEIRQEAAKTSVSKLDAMLRMSNADGRVRGTSSYHAAGTGRFQSQGVNFNNMPRPRREFDDVKPRLSVLFDAFRREDPDLLKFFYGDELGRPLHLISDAIRGFVWAGPGKEFVQADYSGIEGAVIAWLSGEDWKLKAMFDIIADPSIPDLYRQTAASILNLPLEVVTKKHWARQSVGKVSELACFGPDTRVLTNNGVKAITEVLITDLLWDGVEWVKHQGVISKGVRQVAVVDGIEVTPDHLIKTGRTWTEASLLASDRNILALALETGSANLPSWISTRAPAAVCAPSSFGVHAEQSRTKSRYQTSEKVRRHAATRAQEKRPQIPENAISAMTMSFRMRLIELVCSIVSQRALTAARTLMTQDTPTTAGAAFPYFGAAIGEPFLNISSRWTDGTNRDLNSTGSTSTATTRQEIFGSLLATSTPATGEKRRTCSGKSKIFESSSQTLSPVFDILMAGPRNCFTIFSDSGALIVHNCGFQGSVSAFLAMARNYNVNLDALYPAIWENADDEMREKAIKRYEASLKRKEQTALMLSREAWLACWIIVQGWRAANPKIRQSWYDLEDAIREAIQNPGTVAQAARTKYLVAKGFLWAQLPSGRCLAYGSPRLKDQVWAKRKIDGEWADAEVMEREEAERLERKGECQIQGPTKQKVTALGVNSVTKKWERFALYGGLAQENNTQGTARDLLVNGMWKAEGAGYPVVATVYDELLAEVDYGFGDVRAFEKLICELPAWADGLPLTAGGWRGKRYRKD